MKIWFIISVRFLHGRYHGRAEGWPPSPFRLFQAIVAGARAGRWRYEDSLKTEAALSWIETLGAPDMILAPKAIDCSHYRLAVPNNQADLHVGAWLKGTKPLETLLRGTKEIKEVRPKHVGFGPLRYAWAVSEKERDSAVGAGAAIRRLYALGTGIDPVVADGWLSEEAPAAADTDVMFQFSESSIGNRALDVPVKGALAGLSGRYELKLKRLEDGWLREQGIRVPTNRVAYTASGDKRIWHHLTFALRDPDADDRFSPLPVLSSPLLAAAVRNELADRLREACSRFPEHAGFDADDVERLVLGRGAGESDKVKRVYVLPLPSVGHDMADGAVRRLLISAPLDSPFPIEAVERAMDGQIVEMVEDNDTLGRVRLLRIDASRLDPATRKTEKRMLERFAPSKGAVVWRTATPVVLPGFPPKRGRAGESPEAAMRRDAERRKRTFELARKALRHAGFHPEEVAVTRLRVEPFRARGERADAGWRLPRSPRTGEKWLDGRPRVHLELTFQAPVGGPVCVGDGRFLGLGLFTAVDQRGVRPGDDPAGRRAKTTLGGDGEAVKIMLLSLSSESGDGAALPPVTRTLPQAELFHRALTSHATRDGGTCPAITGCDEAGRPLKGPHDHAHVLPLDLDGDGHLDHVLVWASGGLDRDAQAAVRAVRQTYAKGGVEPIRAAIAALGDADDLRRLPGEYGRRLRAVLSPAEGALEWVSLTPFVAPRYLKKAGKNTLEGQVAAELASRGLPAPAEVRTLDPGDAPESLRLRHFVRARRRGPGPPVDFGYCLKIRFETPVAGPLCLGYGGHFGLGLFSSDLT